ncbi:MAG: CPBP family intramembrane metalloprotease [Candidatus Peregrinibacteria bacterium]|nr:CPBP family intramembrane metalloprotease [Candidatus Peregrinibacteria bacterium]
MSPLVTVLSPAALPFLAKGAVLAFGLTGYVLQSSYKILQLLIPIVWRYRSGARGLRILWPTNEPLPSFRVWMYGVAIALLSSGLGIAALLWAAPFFALDPAVIRAGFDTRFAVGSGGAVAVVLFLGIANAGLEELHFRAWLDREISRRSTATIGIIVSAFAFGSMHALIFAGLPGVSVLPIAAAVLGITIMGVLWSLLMRMRGGIHACVLSHGLTDVLLLGWGLQWLGYI